MKKLILFSLMIASINQLIGQSNYIGSGISVQFSGTTGNYINLGDVYNDLNFPVTVEAWVKPTGWTPGGYSPIIATDIIGVGGSYYGFWFRFNSSGQLIFEIGDGSGAGGSDRRGKVTTSSVSLNKWTHVAVVATSVTDIKFYFNGVLQISNFTDGGASNTSILHTTYSANIGRQITPTTEHDFTGQIDEVRLWNVARTETQIRDYMCLKITTMPINLIGYWNFDESYVDATANDITTPAENGTTGGTVTKLTSGAPIGDARVYSYTADFTGVTLSLNSSGGDILKVNKIGNAPYGVHLYRVNFEPYSTAGLASIPNYYYGVFTADHATAAKYTINYLYSYDNGVVDSFNEVGSKIYKRLDGSVTMWTNLSALLDTGSNKLTKKNIATRDEFIFNYKANARFAETEPSGLGFNLKVNPNPATSNIIVESVSQFEPIQIFDISGKLIKSYTANQIGEIIIIDISEFTPGIYIVKQNNLDNTYSTEIIIQ